jgi:hypothetical protein
MVGHGQVCRSFASVEEISELDSDPLMSIRQQLSRPDMLLWLGLMHSLRCNALSRVRYGLRRYAALHQRSRARSRSEQMRWGTTKLSRGFSGSIPEDGIDID